MRQRVPDGQTESPAFSRQSGTETPYDVQSDTSATHDYKFVLPLPRLYKTLLLSPVKRWLHIRFDCDLKTVRPLIIVTT